MPIAVSSVGRFRVSMLCAVLALHGGRVGAQEPEAQEPAAQESAAQPADLMGEWCLVRKRMVTKYTVTAGKLQIRGGRSGHLHEADLRCDDAYTRCEAKTLRGWGTPVSEILRLDGERMELTRVWGGSWNGKTYRFVYTRCPKW
jgi:hypothetical protein